MEKRNRLWRKRHQWRLFKKRMIWLAANGRDVLDNEGNLIQAAHWFELMKIHWCQVYRTTGRPCSCYICKGERYNRRDFKRETQRIIREEEI